MWGINYYNFTTSKEDYEKNIKTYSKQIDDYIISYKKPDYLQFTGNYSISDYEDTLSIILWPSTIFTKDINYGVQIYDIEENHGYMFYVDKDLNYMANNTLDPRDEEIAKVNLKNNHDELLKMFNVLKAEIKTY